MTDTPKSFAEALIAISNTSTGGKCRVSIRKAKLKPADRDNVEQAFASQVSALKIIAAFKLIAEDGDLPIGEASVKHHRLETCTCYKVGGEFYEEGGA